MEDTSGVPRKTLKRGEVITSHSVRGGGSRKKDGSHRSSERGERNDKAELLRDRSRSLPPEKMPHQGTTRRDKKEGHTKEIGGSSQTCSSPNDEGTGNSKLDEFPANSFSGE